jgi:hypothetical protein
MKDIIKSTILGALIFSIGMVILMNIFIEAEPIFIFFFSFLGFWVLIFLFQLFMLNKSREIAKEISGKIYYQGSANHFINWEGVGWYFFIADNKIIFKSHSFNVQNHDLEIQLKDIIEVNTYNNLWIIPNGLEIVQKTKTDKFVVNNRAKIMGILNKGKK